MKRGLCLWLVLVAGGVLAGCDAPAEEHLDTGYGANQPVPASETCAAICQRLADCTTDLCDEDTNSTRYAGSAAAFAYSCESTCSDAQVMSAFPTATWSCLFTATCREVLGQDSCHAMGHYSCS